MERKGEKETKRETERTVNVIKKKKLKVFIIRN